MQLLERKFGSLSPSCQAQLSQAGTEQLQAWSLNVLDAGCIEDIFA